MVLLDPRRYEMRSGVGECPHRASRLVVALEVSNPSLDRSIAELRALFLPPIEERRLNGPGFSLALNGEEE
jgi:hypothetical protein